jgi:hypothetical protein
VPSFDVGGGSAVPGRVVRLTSWVRCQDGGVDQIVEDVIAAVERQDWLRVRALLHPYLHWTDPQAAIRGRSKVMARLAAGATFTAPVSYELRDGQIYRWTST